MHQALAILWLTCLCNVHMVSTAPVSLNRLNFGVSLKEIGRSFVVGASFQYDILVALPNKTSNIKPYPIIECNVYPVPINISFDQSRKDQCCEGGEGHKEWVVVL